MTTLAARRCVRHVEREAVARCPSCGHDYCRECIVEHEGQVLCASCLARAAALAPDTRPPLWQRLGEPVVTGACVLLLTVVFYAVGQFLASIPAVLHEGTIWNIKP